MILWDHCRANLQLDSTLCLQSGDEPHLNGVLPPVRAGLHGLSETVEELTDLFMDPRAPVQLAILTGAAGIGTY